MANPQSNSSQPSLDLKYVMKSNNMNIDHERALSEVTRSEYKAETRNLQYLIELYYRWDLSQRLESKATAFSKYDS